MGNQEPKERYLPNRATDPTVARRAIVFAGILIAIALGGAIGTGNLILGGCLLVLGLALAYMVVVRPYTWQLALLICYLQFAIEPGFKMGPTELSGGLALLLVIVQIWHNRDPVYSPFFESNAFRFFRNMLFLWLFYAVIRFLWNFVEPFKPAEYGFANAIKSEFTVTAVMLVMWIFCLRPWNITVKANFTNIIAICLLVGLLVNVVIRIYGIKTGVYSDEVSSDDDDIDTVLNIPGLNLTESIYALRYLGPFAVLYGVIFLSSPRQKQMPLMMRIVHFALVVGGLAGSAMSGGRATVLLACALCVGILAVRRKVLALAILGIGLFGGFCAINLFSQKILSDPSLITIERSFYWAMLDRPGAHAAADSIKSSTEWRQTLFNRAYQEWKSDPFEIWLGRGTYKVKASDWLSDKLDPEEASLDLSLRRGATHNLITDLLVAYGLIGVVIYLVVCFAIVRFCWRMFTHPAVPEDARDLALLSALWAALAVLQGVTAGVFYGMESGWLIVILLGRVADAARRGAQTGEVVGNRPISAAAP
jgi:O-Antigen ligase